MKMARKSKKSALVKIEDLIADANTAKWCLVNTENEFDFEDSRFKIDNSVEQYKVFEKGIENIAQMDMILCVDDGEEVKFYDQLHVEISSDFVRLV